MRPGWVIMPLLAILVMGCGGADLKRPHPDPVTIDRDLILPPAWTFGVLYGGYTDQRETVGRIEQIISHDYPIDACWIDSWFWSYADQGRGPHKYIDFVADTVAYPDRKGMWDFMEERNIKGGFWVWDCIFETGNEEAFRDFDERGYSRDKYYETNPWHNNSATTAMHARPGNERAGTLTGNIDFGNPGAVAYFQERMKHFFDEGADFVKLDRTSAIPVCKAMFEMTREYGLETGGRGFIMSHTGGMESGEYKRYPGKWTDDTRTDWDTEDPAREFDPWVPHVALKENIAMFADSRLETSRIPFLANDMGGFDMGISAIPDEELYIRWLQFSFFTPVVEVFSQPENPTSNLAYNYSPLADRLFRKYSHLRMELFPYIYSYAHASRLEGVNIIRPVAGQAHEYFFGNEFFVAPVYERGAELRSVDMPEGVWVDYWTGKRYKGGKVHHIPVTIEDIPVFVREGSMIPKRTYSRSIESGSNDRLILEVFPGSESSFMLVEDDGISNDYLEGIYAVTSIKSLSSDTGTKITVSPVSGYYDGMKSEREWQLSFPSQSDISQVTVNGRKIKLRTTDSGIVSDMFMTRKNRETVIEIVTP